MTVRNVVLVTLRISAFLAFVWLCREFFAYGEIDACVDDGGVANESLGVCTDSRHGQWQMVSDNSYWAWLVSLGLPALLVFSAYALVRRWLLPRARGAA
jgi:hypothetical protein